jgi:uncharacterized protein YbjT (DUF2867 family)
MRTRFAPQVSAFLDLAEAAGVRHVTYLSAYGIEFAPTGPEVLTVSDAADIIGTVTGRPIRHVDIDRRSWLDSVTASGVPGEYGEMLQSLTETVSSGRGSRPNGDVEKVTGAPPGNFTDFARRAAAAWTGEAPR